MTNKLIVVDVEADGPCPGLYSMVCFGACIVENTDKFRTFYGETAPISNNHIPEALAVSGFTRDDHLTFPMPVKTIHSFMEWLRKECEPHKPTLISDNPAFDWQFINYYLHAYTGTNPFGFSARRIGDIYCGLTGNLGANTEWKKLRKTKHDHNPVNDSIGNAESLLAIFEMYKPKLGGIVL